MDNRIELSVTSLCTSTQSANIETMRTLKLAPSIMTADFARLGDQVREAIQAGVDRIHLDIMDGHYVPNISFGPLVAKSLRPVSSVPLEVHLMISEPARYVDSFLETGVDSIILHVEACPEIEEVIRSIKSNKKQVGVTLNPTTPLLMVEHLVPLVDLLLVMSVQPGFGGQSFIPSSIDKIKHAREMIDRLNPTCELEVDGGINVNTLLPVYEAGADVVVVGAAVFNNHASVSESVRKLLDVVHAR